MKKYLHRYRLISLFCMFILLFSCSPSLYEIAVDIRESARIPLNIDEKSIAVYVAVDDFSGDAQKDFLLASGIASKLEEELELSKGAVYIYTHYPPKDSALSMEYIQSLSRQADSDIIFLIDSVSVFDTKVLENHLPSIERGIYILESISGEDVEVTITGRNMYNVSTLFNSRIDVYDGVTAENLATLNQRDSIYWAMYLPKNTKELPSQERIYKIVSEIIPDIGEDVASRFFPSWKTEYRNIYRYGGDASWRKAFNYAIAFDWDSAIKLWTAYIDENNWEGYSAACASINIAVGCEMTDRSELALEWLNTAEQIHELKKVTLDSYRLRLKQEIEKREMKP